VNQRLIKHAIGRDSGSVCGAPVFLLMRVARERTFFNKQGST